MPPPLCLMLLSVASSSVCTNFLHCHCCSCHQQSHPHYCQLTFAYYHSQSMPMSDNATTSMPWLSVILVLLWCACSWCQHLCHWPTMPASCCLFTVFSFCCQYPVAITYHNIWLLCVSVLEDSPLFTVCWSLKGFIFGLFCDQSPSWVWYLVWYQVQYQVLYLTTLLIAKIPHL